METTRVRVEPPEAVAPPSQGGVARRAVVVAGVVTLFAAAAAAFARAYDVFFLFFAAVLLAVLLRGLADRLDRRTGLGPGWSLAIVLVAAVVLGVGGAYAVASMAAGQLDRLVSDLPRSLDQARAYLRQSEWGRAALDHAPTADGLRSGGPGNAASAAASFFSTTFGVLGNLLVLTFLAVYLAASPRLYLTGLLMLVPPRHRNRAGQVTDAVEFHLWWWLVGRAVAMAVVAAITTAGLWLAGVPQFLVLGLLAGVLTAVPFVGPILAAIPGVLLALLQGPTTALWALGVYVAAQAVENYLVTPLVQQNTVSLPPAVAIAAITLVGALFGVLGLVVATPLSVAVMVAVKMLYVEDVLGNDMGVPEAGG
jgi:predicted PurR-regulated permease PerM